MNKTLSHKLRSGLVLLAIALLFSLNPLSQDLIANAASLPVIPLSSTLAAATMPTAANCTLSGTTRTCNLWAKAGTISLPGLATPLTAWGYTDTATGAAQIPGPTLVVNQGETLKIVLTNSLTQPTGLSFPNQDVAPDLSGVAASGGSKTYTFVANTPGTSLYEAGLITGGNGARQVGMGLFGALVVRPSANPASAYGDSASVFASEAVMIFSELDPKLNAAPTSFDMHTYAPKYWLINGKAYPNTTTIPGAAGSKVLLRYLNAGFYDHSIGSLGLRQTVLGQDGRALAHPYQVSAETLAAGQSMDLITTVPTGATTGTKFPLFSAANHLDNAGKLTGTNGSIVFGGMLTFLTVTTGSGTATPTPTTGPNTPTATATPTSTATPTPSPIVADQSGPVTSALVVAPTPNNGTLNSDNSNQGVKITAKATDTLSNIAAAEAFIDNASGADGTGIVLIPTDGVFNSKTETVYQYIALSDLVPLAQGPHTITVHSKDAAGNWGAKVSVTLVIDRTPPTISTLAATKNGSNNRATLHLTASDPANGTAAASNIVAAEWFEGSDPGVGKGTAATNIPGTGSSLSNLALTPNINISGWAAGSTHTISVRVKDAAGNWGVVKTVNITK